MGSYSSPIGEDVVPYQHPMDLDDELKVQLSLLPSLDSDKHLQPARHADQILIEKLFTALNDTDVEIQKKIEVLETLDITVRIISFKIFEATHDFKKMIDDVKEERNRILLSIDNTSELSLVLHDLDSRISDLQKQLDDKINMYKLEKIAYQEQEEALLPTLDEDLVLMQEQMQRVKAEVDVKLNTLHRAQSIVINQKYTPAIEQMQCNIMEYEKMQLTGWKVAHSEEKISELLEERGLKYSPSGKLFTRTGSFITFQEAQDKGYLKDVNVPLERMVQFFKDQEHRKRAFEQIAAPQSTLSDESSTESKMSSEDVCYLKQYVGKPLTLALAEITAKQPRDPIHYLGHYLFKYRYNQEVEIIQKKELEELTEERKRVAAERWKKFVEEEARNIVIELILRAEEIAYQNELRRIEQEQLLAQQEEEEDEEDNREMNALLEEARDKFE